MTQPKPKPDNGPKLKPVTFISGKCNYHKHSTTQQLMLLKALKVTQDPLKLKQMIGVKTVADVYRTLDKMAMRKEYHEALTRSGISFDYLVEKTKEEIESGNAKSADKLNAIKMLLKSLGMEKYEQEGLAGGNWEDLLIKASEKEDAKKIESPKTVDVYEVKTPKMPDSVKKIKDKDNKIGQSLYE